MRGILSKGLGILILLLFLAPSVYGVSDRAIQVVPDDETRSTIVTVDGYSYLAPDKTINEIKKMAFAEARRQALENANVHIQSNTKVKNGALQYDIVEIAGVGELTVLEQKDYGIERDNRYHVWIRAEVRYRLKPPKTQESQALLMDEEAPLTVKVWTERKQYNHGEHIKIYLEGNKDFYARIVDISAGGDIIQLLPNAYRRLNQFKGGITYTIPDEGDQFDLLVVPPYGQEKIIVYASEAPLGDISLDPIDKGLYQYRGTTRSLERGVRAIMPVKANTEFYEGKWVIETIK